MAAPNTWTPQRVETLKACLADGYSAAMIAMRLGDGITRNAVIGKIARLGLQPAIPQGRKVLVRKPREPRQPGSGRVFEIQQAIEFAMGAASPVLAKSAPLPAVSSSGLAPLNLGLLELSANGCRWPVNDAERGEDHLFCGHPALAGKSYCAEHQVKALDRAPARTGHRPAYKLRSAA